MTEQQQRSSVQVWRSNGQPVVSVRAVEGVNGYTLRDLAEMALSAEEHAYDLIRQREQPPQARLMDELPLRKRVGLLLRGGPLTVADIAEETNANLDTVRKVLQRGAGDAFVQLPASNGRAASWALKVRD